MKVLYHFGDPLFVITVLAVMILLSYPCTITINTTIIIYNYLFD